MNDWLTLSMMSNWILWWTLWAQFSPSALTFSPQLPWAGRGVSQLSDTAGRTRHCPGELSQKCWRSWLECTWLRWTSWRPRTLALSPPVSPHHCWGSPCPTQWGSPPLTLWLSLSRDSAELDIQKGPVSTILPHLSMQPQPWLWH